MCLAYRKIQGGIEGETKCEITTLFVVYSISLFKISNVKLQKSRTSNQDSEVLGQSAFDEIIIYMSLNKHMSFFKKFFKKWRRRMCYHSYTVVFRLKKLDKPYLRYLETHLCDHCNLNCKSCTHFCPLVTEPTFTDLEQYTKDIRTLSKKLAIRTIRLMGGEPLLHPQVNDFIRVTRSSRRLGYLQIQRKRIAEFSE